jgi:hypothetical protein
LFKIPGSGWRTVRAMNTPKLATLAVALTCVTGSITASAADPPDFRWLSGHWCLDQDGSRVEEAWLEPRGGMILATGRTVKAGKAVSFEFLRIVWLSGAVEFIAQPNGEPPVTFKLTSSGKDWAVFENPQHDFPKRVEYRRTSAGLLAQISGPGGAGAEQTIPFDYRACMSGRD